jgi:AcrR family transcriptional regulator
MKSRQLAFDLPGKSANGTVGILICLGETGGLLRAMQTVESVPAPVDEAAAHSPPPPYERLMTAATRLFCRYGVNSVGVDAIVAAADTAKTTLYKLFGSKEGLVEKVLEREGETWRGWFLAEIDGSSGAPMERLMRIGPALRSWFSREEFYGCPFINVVGESDKADDRMRNLALAHKKIVLRRLTELCADAGLEEAAQTAHTLGLVIDGAIVAALITRDPAVADNAGRACAAILSSARA